MNSEETADHDQPPEEEDAAAVTALDLTSYQLHDLDSVEFPPSLIELDLTANRLSKLDPRISLLSHLTKLSLRQNLFDDAGVEPLSHWDAISGLEELVFRDNKLMKIPDVSIFRMGCQRPPTLSKNYICPNEIPKIEEIGHFTGCKFELGSNRLRVMENLEALVNLQELWLGRNRIKAVHLCGLKCIKKLSLQSNRLTSMKDLRRGLLCYPCLRVLFSVINECVALEELYLSHNGISKMDGLSTLVNLRVLDICGLMITRLQPWKAWLMQLPVQGRSLPLSILNTNPCANSPNYTATLRQIFPNIQQIDSQVFA
ncbi:hypothetical protein Cgig2_023511 [Carnegiea gigantea]|uniref:Uncharacterized protein n=1 Tax=Carnegiea gigantea TaxID=171969 RepID=A0A9Q1JW02_9CARY|nr:hypothetical protein Cgig2_023511 [Carnegiea gigantea]